LQIKKIVSCHKDDSEPVKQEVNGTVILPPLVFPDIYIRLLFILILVLKQVFAKRNIAAFKVYFGPKGMTHSALFCSQTKNWDLSYNTFYGGK
jgi:hypothetical protein